MHLSKMSHEKMRKIFHNIMSQVTQYCTAIYTYYKQKQFAYIIIAADCEMDCMHALKEVRLLPTYIYYDISPKLSPHVIAPGQD